jgi:hypothetical protein
MPSWEPPPSPRDSIHADDLEWTGPAALRTYFEIAAAWRLDDAERHQLLGNRSPTRLLTWRESKSALENETLQRISRILSIYRALQVLLPSPDQADAWVRRPNAAIVFGGRSALDVMLSSDLDGLQLVQSYLNSQLHG